MSSHLQYIAQTFARNVGKELPNYTFVFPNHRAGLFFRKYLAQSLSFPIFAPKIQTINECFASLCDITVADQLTLLLRLYKIYKQIRPDGEPLENFLHWGKMMLTDFSEIDNHLVKDVKSLYAHVKDMRDIDTHFSSLTDKQIKAIEHFWGKFHHSVESNNNASIHGKFLRTWELLYPLYEGLKNDLLGDQLAYEGLLHRFVIEHWDSIAEKQLDAQYVFIGFNAMTESERQLMLRIQELGRADFYFDYEDALLLDPHNAASKFMHDNLQLFRSKYTIDCSETTTQDKNITLVSVSSTTSQVHQVHDILSQQVPLVNDWTRTAVVLPNEELLIPLLHAIPEDIRKINVTMGYPLRATAPYVLVAYPENYIKPMSTDASSFIAAMREHLNAMVNHDNSESIYQIIKTIDRIEQAIATNSEIPFSVQAIQQILKMLTMEMTIPFTGEPLDGLQIMGVLETRALEFDNIIITDFNDDIYPGRSHANSFIPYTLRQGFDLPTIERQEAIFSYNFYRMLSHAKNVWFIANTQANDKYSGELSRYFYQLQWQYQLPIKQITISDKLQSSISESLPIDKTTEIQQLFSQYIASSDSKYYLSASAMDDYIRCQKLFYYKYLRQIREPEQDETINVTDATLGNILHEIMQLLYDPYIDKTIQISDIESLKHRIEDDTEWRKLAPLSKLCGDVLAEHVTRSCVINILNYDLTVAPFQYIASEKKYNRTIHIPNLNLDIYLGGKIDRIDTKDDYLRIIDYKTGSTKPSYTSMEEVFGLGKSADKEEFVVRKHKCKNILQMLLYCWLLEDHSIVNNQLLVPHLYAARHLHDIEADTQIEYSQGKVLYGGDIKEEFVSGLTELLEEMFNPNIPFHPTADNSRCQDCYLAQLCHTQKSHED